MYRHKNKLKTKLANIYEKRSIQPNSKITNKNIASQCRVAEACAKKKKKKKNSNYNILPNNFAILCSFLNLILSSRTPQNYLLSSTSWKFGHKFRKFYSFQIKIKILSSTLWKFLVKHVSEIGEKILKIVTVLTPNSFFCIFLFYI